MGSCSDASPMHFIGKQHDDESNLDDFDARYYSSQWGRFISADWSAVPVSVPYANFTNPQTLNLYAIVADNPGTFADLNGHTSALAVSNQGPTPQFPCSDISGPAGENCWYESGALQSTATAEMWTEGDGGQFDPVLEEQAAEGRALDASFFQKAQQQIGTNPQFKTANQAATAALKAIFPTSEKQHVEYGGRVYKNANDTYSYTTPVTQREATAVNVDAGGREGSRIPPGTTNAGIYHTHENPAPGMPAQEGFSGPDAQMAVREHVPSYIETPSGLIHEINGTHATSYLTAPQYTWRVNGPIP